MKAVACTHGRLEVVELPDPRPGRGQVVLEVLYCGICGSDLHAKDHADAFNDVMTELKYDGFMTSRTPVVMGHEFCGRIIERGRAAGRGLREGTTVVSFPLLRSQGAVHLTGLTPLAPGGYAEQVLAQGSMTLAVPNGLDPAIAVLTEPMAVALHAVRASQVNRRDVAIVIGCGPVGLAIICHLKAQGVRTIVASDPSSSRRALAGHCGADIVVDPTTASPYEAAGKRGYLTTAPELLGLAVDSMDQLRRIPGWVGLYRVAEKLGAADFKRPVIFECVGAPGMIEGILTAAPLASRIVVVGVCMQADRIRPAMAVNKELQLKFVLGYSPLEFRDTLHLLADGKVDASALVTSTVGLEGVANAFEALSGAEAHAKILIAPGSTAGNPIRSSERRN